MTEHKQQIRGEVQQFVDKGWLSFEGWGGTPIWRSRGGLSTISIARRLSEWIDATTERIEGTVLNMSDEAASRYMKELEGSSEELAP